MLLAAYFHSNTMGLNTTAVQLKAMGTLCGVPLQSLLMDHIMPGEIVIQRNVKQDDWMPSWFITRYEQNTTGQDHIQSLSHHAKLKQLSSPTD